MEIIEIDNCFDFQYELITEWHEIPVEMQHWFQKRREIDKKNMVVKEYGFINSDEIELLEDIIDKCKKINEKYNIRFNTSYKKGGILNIIPEN